MLSAPSERQPRGQGARMLRKLAPGVAGAFAALRERVGYSPSTVSDSAIASSSSRLASPVITTE